MTFYEDMQKTASDILSEFNQGEIKLIQFTYPNTSPDEPGEPVETVHDLKGTVSGINFQYIQEGFIPETDLTLVVSVVKSITININDIVEIDGVKYKIVKDISTPSAGVKVVWKFIIRRGG